MRHHIEYLGETVLTKTQRGVQYAGRIPVLYFKEGPMFVWYSPAFDLSSCGPTFEEAKRNFHEALQIFFEECVKRGTLEHALESLGWQKSATRRAAQWRPPVLIGQDSLPVGVPVAA